MNLVGLTAEEIATSLKLNKAYQARQIFHWIYADNAVSFSDMTNISKEMRASLSAEHTIFSTKVLRTVKSSDGTTKLQLCLTDKNIIECVLLTDKSCRHTACLSTQAGCAMGCSFCKTGSLGFARNLTTSEILQQYLHLAQIAPKISNIVFMGMGEPLLNLENVRSAVSILCAKDGASLSPRRFTLSTCGIVPQIISLADNGPQINLAVSLVCATQSIRDSLMQISKQYPLPALLSALQYFVAQSNRRITLEAVLLHNINTTPACAKDFLSFAKSIGFSYCVANLIPWNPIPALPFQPPMQSEVDNFAQILRSGGLNTTIRYERGASDSAACGQLGVVLEDLP